MVSLFLNKLAENLGGTITLTSTEGFGTKVCFTIILKINKISKFDEFAFNRSNYLEIKVIDTGVGISKEDIPHLFKMFWMVDKQRVSLNFKGTGLGLSISK